MKELGTDQLLAVITQRLDGGRDGWVSLTAIASELGVGRPLVQIVLDFLRAERRIEVLGAERGHGTHVRIIESGGDEMLGTKQSRVPMDLRDSDPGGMLSGPVVTRRLTEEERRALGSQDRRPAPAQPVEADDWEPIMPAHSGRRDDLFARVNPSRGVHLSAGASRRLLGDRTGEIRLAVERSRSRRQMRLRPDPVGRYRTTYRPPAQGSARVGGGHLVELLVELGAERGRAYEVRFEDGWAVIDLTRAVGEVKAP